MGAEHLSAAAYLGTAGLVLAYGTDMLWLPVAGTAGYVLLLAFVAAPLRRSGAYTVPDFAEWRLGSRAVRRIAAGCVCLIGWFSLLPQFQGAGVAMHLLTGAPLWTGWAVVAAVVLLIVLHGGVCSITAVQAVQFWGKLAALAVPAVALLALWNLDGRPGPVADAAPHFERTTRVQVQTEAAVTVPEPVTVVARGRVDGTSLDGEPVRLVPGPHTVGRGTVVVFPAGAAVPHAEGLPVRDGSSWATPFGAGEEHALYRTCSALLGIVLGTMGLSHILMRFYTNTSGSAARLYAGSGTGRAEAVVAQPTLIAAPAVFAVMVGVSLLTRRRVPRHAGRALARMHLPDGPAAPPALAGTDVPGSGSR
ncbi:MAG: hypothetical protein FWJ90_04570 [Actinomadura sp.]